MSSVCDKAIMMQVDTAYRKLVIPKVPFNNTIEVIDVTDVPKDIRNELIHSFTQYHEYLNELQSKILSYEDWIITQNNNPLPKDTKQFKISLSMLSIIR
jgi:hypothetical protein